MSSTRICSDFIFREPSVCIRGRRARRGRSSGIGPSVRPGRPPRPRRAFLALSPHHRVFPLRRRASPPSLPPYFALFIHPPHSLHSWPLPPTLNAFKTHPQQHRGRVRARATTARDGQDDAPMRNSSACRCAGAACRCAATPCTQKNRADILFSYKVSTPLPAMSYTSRAVDKGPPCALLHPLHPTPPRERRDTRSLPSHARSSTHRPGEFAAHGSARGACPRRF